jgi:hypothetical protein
LLDYYVRIVVIWIAMRSGVSSTFMGYEYLYPLERRCGLPDEAMERERERGRRFEMRVKL